VGEASSISIWFWPARPKTPPEKESIMKTWKPTNGARIKAWVGDMPIEASALEQLDRVASMPFIFEHLAVMPDVHWGHGATVGSVIATRGAVIPAAVGVDLGCGMIAQRTTLTSHHLPECLSGLRSELEKVIPHGRTNNGGRGDRGAWHDIPDHIGATWASGLAERFAAICEKRPELKESNHVGHLGTLGTGNHFVEVCLDEEDRVWLMLHSGSRGIGARIGGHFIEAAKRDMERWFIQLPDKELAYIPDGSELFADYLETVAWAQDFAALNRGLMMEAALGALRRTLGAFEFATSDAAVNCHHNYISREHHFGQNVIVTRKGAVRARTTDLGIIPGSMGARSFIVRGKGNQDSFCSCSHGAGRKMSRTEAKKRFTLEDHAKATTGIECRKDEDVIDETPGAYKDIDAVMAAQADLVEVVHTLRQVVCVKG
jgi:tRNA-splicing ligase RtcB